MAQTGGSKTISSVSDILGFVLEQSELPPEKRTAIRPPKASDIQSDSEYVGALVDALALPGTFVGDEYLKTLQSLIDPAIKVQTSQDRIGSVKIKASDIPSFFENPDDFVDKLFAKNKEISKAQKLRWAGEQMKMLAGSTYAKKMNFFDNYSPEMKKIMVRAVGQAASESGQPSDATWMAQASEKILNEGNYGKKIGYKELRDKYYSGKATEEEKKKFASLTTPTSQGFRQLLHSEFQTTSNSILKGRDPKELTNEEYKKYSNAIQSKNMMELWNKPGPERLSKKLMEQKKVLLKQRKALESGGVFNYKGTKIDFSRYSDVERRNMKKELNKQVRQITGTSRSIGLWSGLGDLEGKYHGIKSTLGPGGLEAFANGDFFDPKYGYFGRPSQVSKLSVSLGRGKSRTVEFFGLRDDRQNNVGGNLLKSYDKAMLNLYYLNPVTMMKSLVTGERAAWRASNKLEKLSKMWGVEGGVLGDLKTREFWEFYKKFKKADPEEQALLLVKNEQYRNLISKITLGLKNKDSGFAKKFMKAEKLAKEFERLSNLAAAFNTPMALYKDLLEKTLGKAQGFFRDQVVGLLSKMKMFSGNDAAMSLLSSWAGGAGGKALAASISTAIVSALGLAGTAIGGPLGTAITLAVAAALEKITKVGIKFIIFAVVGIFGVAVLLIGGVGTHKSQAGVDTYSREIPGTIYYNPAFAGYGVSGVEDGNDIPDGPDIIPPITDEDCILGQGYKPCTQGWSGTERMCFSHYYLSPRKPIDLTSVNFIYAPQFCSEPGANCQITSVGKLYCGGIYAGGDVWFNASDGNTTYRFRVLHVRLIGGYSSGSKVPGGQAFAIVEDNITRGPCWSGKHLHFEALQNGSVVDPLKLLQSFNCDVPDQSGCTNCVGSR